MTGTADHFEAVVDVAIPACALSEPRPQDLVIAIRAR
jgi:hypothetical protein